MKRVMIVCEAVFFVLVVWAHIWYDGALVLPEESEMEGIYIYNNYDWTCDYKARLDEEDMAYVASLLAQVRLRGMGTEDYLWDGVFSRMYYIKLKDGTGFGFSASNPFYIIDHAIGYKSDYYLAEDLRNEFYELNAKYFKPE